MKSTVEVLVVGHICLDIIPNLLRSGLAEDQLLTPGRLVHVDRTTIATGGAVANTGVALHRLGHKVHLIAMVGDDLWGHAIQQCLRRECQTLADGLLVNSRVGTSHTIVISPPGVDRAFLHHPGANDRFGAADVPFERFSKSRIFHFGYPPLMRRMYAHDGEELVDLFRRAKRAGMMTSLDMAMPDPTTSAGQVDWAQILKATLPYVDIFLPSADEILLMLRPDALHDSAVATDGSIHPRGGIGFLADLANLLIQWGAGIVGLKLGDQGLYLRTASQERLTQIGRHGPRLSDPWAERELLMPVFQADVKNTTGAGDTTVAGFLSSVLRGEGPEESLEFAVAVGGHCVEAADATSGIPTAHVVKQRIEAGWTNEPPKLQLPGWKKADSFRGWKGPSDRFSN